jgi:multicomponent Na+:H+ antiporter subunit G
MLELLTSALMLSGGFFALTAALGVLRLSDILLRMHASTKAGTLGVGLILAAVAVQGIDAGIVLRALAAVCFMLLTAPVAAHVIGRAAYKSGVALSEHTRVDEFRQSRSSDEG